MWYLRIAAFYFRIVLNLLRIHKEFIQALYFCKNVVHLHSTPNWNDWMLKDIIKMKIKDDNPSLMSSAQYGLFEYISQDRS